MFNDQELSNVFYRRVEDKIKSYEKRINDGLSYDDFGKALSLSQRIKGLEIAVKLFRSSKQELKGK
jgi:hypothetical protein